MLELAPARVASEEYASCWTPPHETTLTMQADSFGWGALWAALGAIFGTIIAGFSAWLTQRSKGDSERDVAVLAQWERLTAALSDRITALENELAEVRRSHSGEIEEMRKTHRAEMRTLRALNDGLQRIIAQNSQSTAHLIGETPASGSLNAAFTVEDEGGEK